MLESSAGTVALSGVFGPTAPIIILSVVVALPMLLVAVAAPSPAMPAADVPSDRESGGYGVLICYDSKFPELTRQLRHPTECAQQ